MMLSMATAALMTAAPAPLPVTSDQLPNLFIAACLDGTARTSAGSVSPIEFSALPSALRHHLANPSEAHVWKVEGAEPGYLYSLRYADRRSSPKVCGVASEYLSIRPAAAAVEMRLYGHTSQGDPASRSIEWQNNQVGYRAFATRKGNYTILQVNWLTDGNQAEAPTPQ